MDKDSRDKQLIRFLIRDLNVWAQWSFSVVGYPDLDERKAQAVDALAVDKDGRRLAVEHTLLQPFTGEKEDASRFLAVAGRLDQRADLAEPNWCIDLVFAVGGVPKGIDWEQVGERLERWFSQIRASLQPGTTPFEIGQLPVPVQVTVIKSPLPDTPGKLFVARSMPEEPVDVMVKKALTAKLPKLVATAAGERILLLEMDAVIRGEWEIGEAIESARPGFEMLSDVSSVWLVRTGAWEREGWVAFYLIWPLDLALKHQEWRQEHDRHLLMVSRPSTEESEA